VLEESFDYRERSPWLILKPNCTFLLLLRPLRMQFSGYPQDHTLLPFCDSMVIMYDPVGILRIAFREASRGEAIYK